MNIEHLNRLTPERVKRIEDEINGIKYPEDSDAVITVYADDIIIALHAALACRREMDTMIRGRDEE